MKAKQLATKIVGAVCALALTVSLAACGGGGGGSKAGNKGSAAEKVEFPLKEKVEFTFMVNALEETDKTRKENLMRLVNELEEKTNVHINWQYLGGGNEGINKLNTIMNGTYGDVIWGGPVLNSTEASRYIASGRLLPIGEYLNSTIMPNFAALMESVPDMKKAITAADSKIYCLPKYTGIMGSFLEGPIYINKVWLDKLGLEVPETLDEFTDVLRAFRDKDPNGNGKADEIPYYATSVHAYMNMEQLLGIWGLGTKNDTNDSFVHVDNGKVSYVPIREGYKEYLKYMQLLYKEKLLYQQWAEENNDDIAAKMQAGENRIGVFTNRDPQTSVYYADYVCIMPPKAEGYEPQWYFHPGYMGSKNGFYVTDKCENLNVLMAWMDQFFDLDVAVKCDYGYPEDGRYEIGENGNYNIFELDPAKQVEINEDYPLFGSFGGTSSPRAFKDGDFESGKLPYTEAQKRYMAAYDMYKDIINKDVWMRPYIYADDADDATAYNTDITNVVTIYRAACITGEKDVDATWDAYVKDVKDAGVDEYVKIMQRAYDAASK